MEIAVLAPAVLLVVFAVVQGALVFHARHVALAAAAEGLAVATLPESTAEQGRVAAQDFIEAAGGEGVLRATSVTASRARDQAEVVVSGAAPVLLPGVSGWSITQSARGPVERFTTEDRP